jgi:hypothetical protein
MFCAKQTENSPASGAQEAPRQCVWGFDSGRRIRGSRKVEVLHLAMILKGGVDGVKDWTGDVDVHGEYEIRTVEGILDFLKVSTGLPEITGGKIDCVIVIRGIKLKKTG